MSNYRPRNLRTLLPAVNGDQAPQPPPPTKPSRRARSGVVITACNLCRRLKAKCNGRRPNCQRCIERGAECRYITIEDDNSTRALRRAERDLRSRVGIYEELASLLKTLPEQEAQNLLQRLRCGHEPEAIVSHFKSGNLLLQMAVIPETRYRYKFPYRSEMPADLTHDNMYLKSILYEATSLYNEPSHPGPARGDPRGGSNHSAPDSYKSLYLKPFHAAEVVDSRLSDVKVSHWTTICHDDLLMRHLLATFFRCEYQFTAALQKNLFLEDMATRKHDFCSSLLVNIVLAYACACYPTMENRSEYWNPHTLLYMFMAEAKRLWELESAEPRITTIQAGIVFNVVHSLCGLDEIGGAYRIKAIQLAHDMHLFDRDVNVESERERNGRAFTAWTLFNWEALCSFSFLYPPTLVEPPDWPLPDPSAHGDWYGEIWVKYPLSSSRTSSYFAHVSKARCEFRVIMNQFCHAAFPKGVRVTLDVANRLRTQLEAWYQALPEPLLPTTIVLPSHLQLHIYYHHLILTMYEPLLELKEHQSPEIQSIVAEAQKNLHILVRLYYLRHGFEAMDLYIVIPLMLMGYESIESITHEAPGPRLESLRSTLLLIAKGLYDQRNNFYLAEVLFQVIRARMRAEEVELLKDTMKLNEEEESGRREIAQAVKSQWAVSVVKKVEDLDTHILNKVVENYTQLNLNG